MEADAEEQDIVPLDERNITYLAPIEGDTREDEIRLQQMRDIVTLMTTCNRLSTTTLKNADDMKKLRTQKKRIGQETHYEQYKTR
eukprot:3923518-Amphidinium_carterae.1